MKALIISLSLFFFCLSSPLFTFAQNKEQPKTIYTQAVIEEINTQSPEPVIRVKVITNPLKDKEFTAHMSIPSGETQIKNIFKRGDKVVISYDKDVSGRENVYVVDMVRRNQLLILFFLFLSVVFLVGRWKGIRSFVGMILSFFIIAQFIVPNILLGNDPVLISLLGTLFIIPITFYLGHGFNTKTHIALLGTFLALVLTGILATVFVSFTKLTGFAVEEASYLQFITGGAVKIQSLLLAGIIIGALGVLDDITISQTAIVEKLKETNPSFTINELYHHAIAVGRDHIASLVNTLILVYTGASFPLILLFYTSSLSFSTVVNQEMIATEIVRTLVSSIGIIMAVPITTLLAAHFIKKSKT